jgi:stage II sporulation protein D
MKFIAHFLLLAAVAGGGVAAAQTAQPAVHEAGTLRVGLWTLWHDKQVSISPVHGSGASLRICANCTATPLKQTMQVQADGDRVSLSEKQQAESVSLTGAVALTAHGESLTLHYPIRISARKGELVLAVTLPVETYVERVVASESGAADSRESLKALAIVVRSFALHEKHGHADYDVCDSTHCQLLHWGGGSGRAPAAHVATLTTAGETL